MKITPIEVEAFEITDVQGLDPVRVILQAIGENQGRIIIECYGQCWTATWYAMMVPLRQFFAETTTDYILQKMVLPRASKRDIAYLSRIISAVQEALAA